MYDIVVLVSGGMDSYIAYKQAENLSPELSKVALWFDINQPYKDKELNALKALNVKYKEFKLDLCREEFGNVPTIEDQVIPGRNFVFGAIASAIGGEVWLSALDGEMHRFMPDKDHAFIHSFTGLASHVYSQYRPLTRMISIFEDKTKAELISYAIRELMIPVEDLYKTSTCYHPEKQKCGICSACVKRAIAFKINGFDEPGYDQDPFQSQFWRDYIQKIDDAHSKGDFSHYSIKRCDEVRRVYTLI